MNPVNTTYQKSFLFYAYLCDVSIPIFIFFSAKIHIMMLKKGQYWQLKKIQMVDVRVWLVLNTPTNTSYLNLSVVSVE